MIHVIKGDSAAAVKSMQQLIPWVRKVCLFLLFHSLFHSLFDLQTANRKTIDLDLFFDVDFLSSFILCFGFDGQNFEFDEYAQKKAKYVISKKGKLSEFEVQYFIANTLFEAFSFQAAIDVLQAVCSPPFSLFVLCDVLI